MQTILAIDQGTTGTTCLVLDPNGRVVGRAYSEFTQYYPMPGWVEHDAVEIWEVTLRVARQALAEAGVHTGGEHGGLRGGPTLAGIGITNQRETVVLWERATGRPLHRAIVWQDRRTSGRCQELRTAGREPWIRERTGLVLDPYFSATKLEWLLDNVPGARTLAERGELAAGTIDSWLIWQLTGGAVHATDPTNASRTLLFGLESLAWDQELLDCFRIPRSILPDVLPSSGVFGVTTPELLGVSVPVCGVAGDQQAALFGQGCVSAGQGKNTYGTGAFLLLNTGDRPIHSQHGLLTTVACDSRGRPAYALEGSIFIAGAAVQWLRDGLGLVGTAAETEELARSLAGNDGVYFVPAFVGLGAPHWEPDVRGTIVGLTRGSGRAHLARAALEAMAYGTADVLEAMVRDAGFEARELAVDGGAAQNDWLMQFQADVLRLPVRRPAMVETTALGAAGLAGLAVGIWPDVSGFLAAAGAASEFHPEMPTAQRDACYAGWKRAVNAARSWARATSHAPALAPASG